MNYLAIMIFKVFMLTAGTSIYTLPMEHQFETQTACEQFINSPNSRPEIMSSVKAIAEQSDSKDIILSNVVCVSLESKTL